jgi:hypothetical protein
MNGHQLFNIEKINEVTNPIEYLQGKLSNLEFIYKSFIESKGNVDQTITDRDFSLNIQSISDKFDRVNENLIRISNENINKFLFFQDLLIKKYKDTFKENLKSLNLENDFTKEFGLFLIENKKISKIINKCASVPTINLEEWLNLLDSLKENSIFLLAIKKVEKFYGTIIQDRLNFEVSKISNDTDPVLIDEYKKAFLREPRTFSQFLDELDVRLTKEELATKKGLIEKTKEKERLRHLKEKQVEQQKSYDDYFNLSNKEFERRRRKKKREKLSDVMIKTKDDNEIEISEEISEKIEKFKLKFEDSFDEKYLIQEKDDQDPLDVIRERKKQKDEEYKDFINKLKKKKD